MSSSSTSQNCCVKHEHAGNVNERWRRRRWWWAICYFSHGIKNESQGLEFVESHLASMNFPWERKKLDNNVMWANYRFKLFRAHGAIYTKLSIWNILLRKILERECDDKQSLQQSPLWMRKIKLFWARPVLSLVGGIILISYLWTGSCNRIFTQIPTTCCPTLLASKILFVISGCGETVGKRSGGWTKVVTL